MCYSIPGKIISIDKKIATVDYFGETKKAVNEFVGAKPGEFVYVQGGFVIDKVSPKKALRVLADWRDIFFKLKAADARISRLPEDMPRNSKVLGVFNKISGNSIPSWNEIKEILEIKDRRELELLYNTANSVRQRYHQNSCCVHGIIEISNFCERNCFYCGISCLNKDLKRYRMTKKEIMKAVDIAVRKYGFKALVLQSGESGQYSVKELDEIIRGIRKTYGVLVFISFGEMEKKDLKRLYDAGARGLLMRFETSNKELYKRLHPGYDLDERLKCIKDACGLGYLIITGSLVGIPGATVDDVVNDLYLASDLNPEMLSFGPFLPHPDTPLAGAPRPKEDDILKVLALARFIGPKDAKVVVTTGFETLTRSARRKGLMAGASSVMLNVTPVENRKLYSIYPNRAHERETIRRQIDDTIQLLKKLGRAPTDLGMKL
ncbi:MAG TPA: radical SAM protein [Candidatus Omnitrophota bacterium]|nr:radical SAM protein [Candidatus Omnitrophota bacterium]HPS20862.1 radical SAM protein [Candidatus Omnitrophota bacterium]